MKKGRWIYIILFFMVCLIPSAGMLFSRQETSSENRTLAEAPSLQDENGWNADYLKDAGAYFEDHFGFRNELVTANAWILGKGFGVSADDSVIVGRDRWLYYKDSLEDYQGTGLMTDRQLFDAAHTLAMIQNYAEDKGIAFAFTIAPNKNSLYGEHMPYYYSGYHDSENNYSNILDYLDKEQVHYVDLYSVLKEQEEVLYHERDSHWNNKGAAIAADTILTYLKKEHESYGDRETHQRRDFTGDLDEMLYPAAVTPENEIYYDPEPEFEYVEAVESNFDPKIYTRTQTGAGSLVMYRDSFGNALLPYFAENYANAYFSRGIPYQLADVLTCQADTLVIERAERFLPEMAQNAPVMAAPVITSQELGDVEYTSKIPDLKIEEQGIYTKITGRIPEEFLQTESRVAIRVNGLLNYEAFPVSNRDGEEGFELYIVTETLESDNNSYDMCIFL